MRTTTLGKVVLAVMPVTARAQQYVLSELSEAATNESEAIMSEHNLILRYENN